MSLRICPRGPTTLGFHLLPARFNLKNYSPYDGTNSLYNVSRSTGIPIFLVGLCIVVYSLSFVISFIILNYFVLFFSFTLYTAHSKLSRGNLVLRHHSRPRFGGHCLMIGGTQRRALLRHQSKVKRGFFTRARK